MNKNENKSNEEIELKIFKNGESDSNSISSSNIDNSSISKSFGNEKDFEKKIQKFEKVVMFLKSDLK